MEPVYKVNTHEHSSAFSAKWMEEQRQLPIEETRRCQRGAEMGDGEGPGDLTTLSLQPYGGVVHSGSWFSLDTTMFL